MGRVAAIGCIICHHMGLGFTPAEVHHIKFESGVCDRADAWLTLPLCVRHHRVEYPESVHYLKERGIRLRYKTSEVQLLAMTYKLVYGR